MLFREKKEALRKTCCAAVLREAQAAGWEHSWDAGMWRCWMGDVRYKYIYMYIFI